MLIPVLGLAAETIIALIAAATVAVVVAEYFSKKKAKECFEKLEKDEASGVPLNRVFWFNCQLLDFGLPIKNVNRIMEKVNDKNIDFLISSVKIFIDSADSDNINVDGLYKHILGKIK